MIAILSIVLIYSFQFFYSQPKPLYNVDVVAEREDFTVSSIHPLSNDHDTSRQTND